MKMFRDHMDRLASRGRDVGFTLVEALVAMVIFTSAMVIMTAVLNAMVNNTRQVNGVSMASDEARRAFQRLDKQVRYADGIGAPNEVRLADGGWYVELSLEPTQRTPGMGRKDQLCRQWRVLSARLESRSWRVNVDTGLIRDGTLTSWVPVAFGIVNEPSQPPFRLALPDAGRMHQELQVDLRTQRSDRPLGRAQIKATFFARNTKVGTPREVCQQVGRSS